MNTKQLYVSLALAGVMLLLGSPARANGDSRYV